MKLASFRAEGSDRIGFELAEGELVDVADALRLVGDDAAANPPADMLALIRAGASGLAAIRSAREHALDSTPAIRSYGSDEVAWHAPVPSPSKVVCLALNNRALDKIK